MTAKKPSYSETLTDAEVLKDLVSRIGEGVYITNEEGAILDANPAMLSMMGVKSVDELRRLPVTQFIEPSVRAQEVGLMRRDGRVLELSVGARRNDQSQPTDRRERGPDPRRDGDRAQPELHE